MDAPPPQANASTLQVSETKGHNTVLEVTNRGVEGSFPLIPLPDSHQMVGVVEIELGKHSGSMQGLKSRTQEGEGVFVLDSYVV